MSRTKNASRNIFFGAINKLLVLFFPFIIKSAIIKTLGSEYLGLNSLFTSILQVLNLAELGFSSAIVFSMYEPIAKNDKKTICALVNLYKKIYRIIGSIIIVGGLAVLPFLNYLIKGSYPNDINIYALYIIYLFNTGLTYFLFAYKSALLTAHQRNDVIANIMSITNLLQYGLQIAVLTITKNYYLFIIVQTITTILNNLLVAAYTKKKYPEYICSGEVSKAEKKGIKKRVVGLMVNKICQTTRYSLDSICISAFLGLNLVAMYSNYYSIIHAVIGVMSVFSSSIIAGIGNSIVTETEKKNYNDMNKFNFMYMWLSGWCTICLACLYQPFMKIWMGEEYMFSYGVVALLCIYFYSLKMGDIRCAYSDARGLWYENRYRAIAESIANIVLNIVLVQFMGIYGIIVGTLLSLLIINFGYGSQILFKHYFVNQKMSEYFLRHGLYALVTAIVGCITFFICSSVGENGVLSLAMRLLICIIIPNILYILIYHRTAQFREAKNFTKKIFKSIKPKLTKRQK